MTWCGPVTDITDIFDLHDDFLSAQSGEVEPFAAYIEAGHPITDGMRKWLAAHLRGELPKRPGNKRLYSQIRREADIIHYIHYLKDFGTERSAGPLKSMEEAIRIYVEQQQDNGKDISEDTVRGYLKRYKARWRMPRSVKVRKGR